MSLFFEEARKERDELQASFDLRWKADMRAIARWREAHPGKELVMPDHADLCVWLLANVDQLRAALAAWVRFAEHCRERNIVVPLWAAALNEEAVRLTREAMPSKEHA